MEMNETEGNNNKNLNNESENKWKISIREKLEKQKHYERILVTIKYIIFILCIIGLIFQTTLLLNEFYSGETVVKTTFEKPELYELPAITVCFRILIPFEKLSEINPKLKPIYDEYENYFFNNSSNETNKTEKNQTFVKQLFDVYEKTVDGYYFSGDINIKEFIDNKTIPYIIKSDNQELYSVYIEISSFDKQQNIVEYNYTDPIESIMWNYYYNLKCYTFLSEQNSDYKNDPIKFDPFIIYITNDKKWAKFHHRIDQFDISLHSPKSIPYKFTHTDFRSLSTKHSYQLNYNKIKTKLLKKPYITNCVDYNLNGVDSEKSRSDCMSNCLYSNIEEKCKLCDTDCSKCFVNLNSIFIRNSLLKNIDNRTLCPFNDCLHKKIEIFDNECKPKCPHECEYEYFDYNVEKYDVETLKFESNNSNLQRSSIYITPNQLPVQLVEHVSPMSTISFISNFGGLLGMWLGLSFLALIETAIKYFDLL